MPGTKHVYCRRVLVTLLLWLCGLIGCGSTDDSFDSAARSSSGASRGRSFPLVVTDFLGRRVRIVKRPERIVSLSPRNTELLFAIGADDRVVGVTTYCNYPPEAAQRPKVGGFSASSLSVETIISLQPDLVVAADDFQRPVIDTLDGLGYPVVSLDAETLPTLLGEIELLGRMTQSQETADALRTKMQHRLDEFEDRVRQIAPENRVSVYFEIWHQPLIAAGPASFIGEVIRLAGGVNMIEEDEARYVPISEEVVLHSDPDVILITSDSEDRGQLDERRGWKNLRAVQSGRVHAIDSDLISRCGPRLIQALEETAAVLYPEHLGDGTGPKKTAGRHAVDHTAEASDP